MRSGIVAVALVLSLVSAGCATTAASGPPGDVPPPPYAGAVPDGQWVQTQQYGWVWMPYADPYTYLPPDAVGEPLEYVYYPSVGGWAWVSAPWVWGVGPWPTFGRRGPDRFAWYGHGWWRTPRRWSYRPAPEPRDRGYARGVRPAPAPQARGAPAPQMRPAPAPQARSAPAPAPRPEGDRRGADGRGKKRAERPRGEGERGRGDGEREAR